MLVRELPSGVRDNLSTNRPLWIALERHLVSVGLWLSGHVDERVVIERQARDWHLHACQVNSSRHGIIELVECDLRITGVVSPASCVMEGKVGT